MAMMRELNEGTIPEDMKKLFEQEEKTFSAEEYQKKLLEKHQEFLETSHTGKFIRSAG